MPTMDGLDKNDSDDEESQVDPIMTKPLNKVSKKAKAKSGSGKKKNKGSLL